MTRKKDPRTVDPQRKVMLALTMWILFGHRLKVTVSFSDFVAMLMDSGDFLIGTCRLYDRLSGTWGDPHLLNEGLELQNLRSVAGNKRVGDTFETPPICHG